MPFPFAKFMRAIVLLMFLLFATAVFGQTDKLVLKENVPDISSTDAQNSDISPADWEILEDAVKNEDWTKSSILAEEYLQSLPEETKDWKKARLRYIYLYSLAGKVIYYSFSNDRDQEEYSRARLEAAAQSFVGRDFVFPVRKILADCKGAVNFVCESKENPGFLHISATNLAGTSIHFSEYIEMGRIKLDVKKHDDSDVILGGRLKGARINTDRSNRLVMTLQFEDGFVYRIYTEKNR